MSRPEFEDLPFYERPDLTPYLTKNTAAKNGHSAFDNLISILETGQIQGIRTFVKGPDRAACFMNVPLFPQIHPKRREHRFR
jgi:hypothetical protein